MGIDKLAGRLAGVGGVIGVALGGSRARGTHRPDSDVGQVVRAEALIAAVRSTVD